MWLISKSTSHGLDIPVIIIRNSYTHNYIYRIYIQIEFISCLRKALIILYNRFNTKLYLNVLRICALDKHWWDPLTVHKINDAMHLFITTSKHGHHSPVCAMCLLVHMCSCPLIPWLVRGRLMFLACIMIITIFMGSQRSLISIYTLAWNTLLTPEISKYMPFTC